MFSQLAPCRKSWWYLLLRTFTYLSSVFHIVFTKSCWCKEIDYTCAFGYNWWQKMFYVISTSPYKMISSWFLLVHFQFWFIWPSSNFLISLYVLILFLYSLKHFKQCLSFGCFLWCWVSTSKSFDQKNIWNKTRYYNCKD